MKTWLAILAATAALGAAAGPEVRVAASVAFTEGPAADDAGNVYFTELRSERILKLSPDGKVSTFREKSGGANGLVIDAAGRLIACEGSARRVTRTDLRTGAVEVLADKLNGPNDVTFDGQGRLYFTDPAPGLWKDVVYRIDPGGGVVRLLGAPEIEQPNGIAISPDDRTLYLVESNGAGKGARAIRAYDLAGDGTLRNGRVFHNFYPGRSADGLCIDTQGNLYAAAGLHQRRGTHETLDTRPGIHVFSPAARLLRYVPIPEDTITNCAFGGAGRKTLYVTAGKTLFQVPVDVPGTGR